MSHLVDWSSYLRRFVNVLPLLEVCMPFIRTVLYRNNYVCIFDKFFPHSLSVEGQSLSIVPSVFSLRPASEGR